MKDYKFALMIIGNRLLVLLLLFFISCRPVQQSHVTSILTNEQEVFWQELKSLCGKAFSGTVILAPQNDTVFRNQLIVMHVRSCDENIIRIPLIVGNNRSRTWIFSRLPNRIELKHDHRHEDGKEDSITMYGGMTTSSGSKNLQVFPADQLTTNILPAAASNIWWVELVPGQYFTYNLVRIGTDRQFSIRFDISKQVDKPEAPWGWKD